MSANLPHQSAADVVDGLVKTSPPLAVTGAMLAGVSLETWVAIATLVYIVLQGAYLVWKWVKELRIPKAGPDA